MLITESFYYRAHKEHPPSRIQLYSVFPAEHLQLSLSLSPSASEFTYEFSNLHQANRLNGIFMPSLKVKLKLKLSFFMGSSRQFHKYSFVHAINLMFLMFLICFFSIS